MNIFRKLIIKKKQIFKQTARSLGVLGLILTMLVSNIPFGTLEFLAQKWSERNIVDIIWQAQNSNLVVDSFRPQTAQAAEILVDDTILDATDEFGPSPTMVFTSDQVGYIFYIDATSQDLAYRKTTNGGVNWSLTVIDTAVTGWTNVSVWYDQWTPGDTSGTKIHIAAADDTSDDIYYTYLDTNGDSLRGSLTAALLGATFTEAVNAAPSITKNGEGNLFISANFASISGSAGGLVAKSTDGGDNWSDITPSGWSSVSTDQIQLLPLLTNDDVIAIAALTSPNTINYRIYSESSDSWDGSWTNIASLIDNATYDQWFSATIKKSTGDIYLAFANRTNNAANDIEFWSFDDSNRGIGFSQGANLFTDDATVIAPVPIIEEDTGDIYVAYLRGRLNNAMDVYFKSSTDGGASWSNESARLNDLTDDFKSIRGMMLSSERLGIAYYCDDRNDIFFSTIHELIEGGINYTITDATDEYGPAPSNLFINDQTGYQFFVRNAPAVDASDEFGPSPAVVFTDADTGYVFFIDIDISSPYSQALVYRKSVDGGATWGGSVIIDTAITGWTNVSVWYDQWTPGDDSGTLIHIAAADDASDDVFYSYLDTSNDTLRSELVMVIPQTVFTEAVNAAPSITKNGEGNLFISANFATTAGGYVYKSTNGGDNWSNITPSGWSSVSADQVQLLPLLTNDDVIAIKAETATDTINYQIYSESSDTWDGSWTNIASLIDNTTYDQWFSATIKKSTGDIYLAFANRTNNAANDIEFWSFDDSNRGIGFSQGANLFTDDATVIAPVPIIEEDTGDIYVAYARGSLGGTMRIYYKSSTDGGASWSAESTTVSPIVGDDIKSIRGSLLHDDNLYIIWNNDDTNQINGANLLSPFARESAITGQSVVYSKTTDGGKNWSTYTVVAPALGATSLAIWYDQWTPGDTSGTKVHIAFSEDQNDNYYYTYLDTSDDTVATKSIPVLLGSVISEAGVGVPGITKGAGGDLFLSGNFNTAAGGKVAKSTDGGNNWTDITPSGWSSVAADQIQLLPLLTNDDVIAISTFVTPNTINYRIYDETNDQWDGSWTNIASLIDNATYDQWFSATIKKSTGDVYLAFASRTNNAVNNIEFWSFDDDNRGISFTKKTNLFDGDATVMMPVPLVNENNGDIYVAYLRGTLAVAMDVYYKVSTDGGASWSAESANLSPGTADDHKALRGNLLSTEKLYVVWYNDDLNDIMGNSLIIFSEEGFLTSIEIRAQDYTTSVSTITFPEGAPESTVSTPYNNVDGSGNPQTFGDAGTAKPVVTLYNGNASALIIWYNITTFTNGIVSSENYLVNTKGTACFDASCITELVTFDTDTTTGTTIAAGAGNEKDLYLKAILSFVAGKSGDSTLTILGESL